MPILLNNLMKPSPSLDLMAIKGCGDDDDDDDNYGVDVDVDLEKMV